MSKPESDGQALRVLILAPTGQDGSLAAGILANAGLASEPCADLYDFCAKLHGDSGAALVAEEALTADTVSVLSAALDRQPAWSEIPLFLLTTPGQVTLARQRLLRLVEVLRNVTFLERPVRVMTLVSTVRAALAARRRQYEVRDLLRKLAEGVRYRDEFLAMLGHELRNPLAAIRNGVALLKQLGPKNSDELDVRKMMERQVIQLKRLVDDLLDVSRVTSGKISLKTEPVDIRDVVRRVVEAMRPTFEQQRQQLHFVPDAEPLVVEGDVTRLEQVVSNMLSNASKYTPAGGLVAVSVIGRDSEVMIRVRDKGVGIAPEMLAKIFEPFTQVVSSLDRAQGGLGLGLTLVRKLVEMHGGSVKADSAGPDRGSEFTVSLPLRAAKPSASPSTNGASPGVADSGRRILDGAS